MNKVFLVFSIIFILVPILLALYPILTLLPTYLSTPHELKPGAQFTYYALAFGDLRSAEIYIAKIDIIYIHLDTFSVSLTVYKLTNLTAIHLGEIGTGGVYFNAKNISIVCNINTIFSYYNSSLIRLLFPSVSGNDTILGDVKYMDFMRIGFTTNGLFSVTPADYVGLATRYGSDIKDIQSTDYTFDFIHVSNHYVAYYIQISGEPLVAQLLYHDFGSTSPKIKELYEEKIYTNPNVITLVYTNVMPSDQAWLQDFITSFNLLFPLSYALVVIGLALLVIGVRRG